MLVTVLLGNVHCAVKHPDLFAINYFDAALWPVGHQVFVVIKVPLFWSEEPATQALTVALYASLAVAVATILAAGSQSF